MNQSQIKSFIEELRDRQAIQDLLARYSRGIDRLDREMLLSVYHPDAIDDHGVFIGGREAFVDWAIAMHTATHLSHQHCVLNHTCELDDGVAHTETYYLFVGMNRAGKPLAVSGGRYIDRMEKRDGHWAIAARVCVRDWAPLDQIPESLDQSRLTVVQNQDDALQAILRSGPQPARERSDISYQRPLRVPDERLQAYRDRAAGLAAQQCGSNPTATK